VNGFTINQAIANGSSPSFVGTNFTSVPAAQLSGSTLAAGVTASSLTSVGALNAGSITSGFGAIDIGADAITAGTGTFSGDLVAQSGGLFVGSSLKQLYLRTSAGINRIDSYDNPITVTVPLQLNASVITLQIADSTKFTLDASGNVTATGSLTAGAASFTTGAFSSTLRAMGTATPASGAGIEFHYGLVGNTGTILVYDRTGAAYKAFVLDGLTTTLSASGNPIAVASSTGLAVTGTTSSTSFFETTEIAAPSAGAANTARIFAVDSGGGKTILKVQFATGAAQTIATEP